MDSLSWRVALPLKIRAAADLALRSFGMKPTVTGWVPLAQVEDKDSPFPAEEQLWPSRMKTIVRNFDALRFRPPVIRAEGGPAHYTGEFADPCGFVTGLDFDGVTLWGRFTEVNRWGVGRIAECVSDGCWGRSIGFWYAYGGTKDNFKLRHVALLGGEPEGQMDQGLPPLTRYFQSAYADMPDGGQMEATRADSSPYAVRSFAPRHAGANPSQEEHEMNDTELRALLEGLATRTATEATAAVTAVVQPLQEQLATVSGTVATLQGELAASRTASAEALAAATTAREALAAQATANREAGYRTRLAAAEQSYRVAAGEIPGTVARLMALPPEMADAYLSEIDTRTPAIGQSGRTVLTIQGEGGDTVVELPPGAGQEGEAFVRGVRSLPADASASDRLQAAYQNGAFPFLTN